MKSGVDSYSFYFPLQFYVSRLETSTVLKDLKPETEYVVNVYSVVEDEYSEPLKGTEKTCKSPGKQQQGYNPLFHFQDKEVMEHGRFLPAFDKSAVFQSLMCETYILSIFFLKKNEVT